MQTRFFKLTSLFLVLVLLVNMLPMSVFAQELQTQQQSAGETAALPGGTEATEAYVVEEVREKRTEFSKEFLLSNGLHMATVYADAVHYETDSGWEEIDNTLKTNRDGTLSNTAGVWEVRLPGQLSADSPITVEKDGHTLSFRLAGELEAGKAELTRSLGTVETETFSLSRTKTAPAEIREVDLSAMEEAVEYPEMVPRKNQSRVAYAGVYDNTDILYDLEANRVKESIVLKSYSQSLRGYRYTLEVGTMVPVLEESGQITFYDAQRKNVVMVMPAPFLVDDAGVHCDDVRVTLTGSGSSYTMTYLLPQQWLAAEDRTWPVVLDPVVEANMAAANIEDQTICEKTSLSHTWGMVEAGYYSTQGKTRFLVKYKNLPTMTSADVVMGAWFTLCKPQSSSAASEIDVHKVTGPWNSQTVTWANAPDYNGAVEDYELVQAADYYTWEVTDIVREWYATNNYGMLFKSTNAVEAAATNNYKQFCSSDYGSDWSKPMLRIIFRNNNGLSGYWDYTSVSAGAAGSGYINNYTGNLVWVREDIGIGGNRMPVTVSHVYNANDKENNAFGMGYGWRTNFNQLMYVWSVDDDYYVWEDEDGTDCYFTMKDGKLQDEDGQGLELTVNSSGTTKYIITDKQGNTRHFDTQGRLVKLQNNQQTKSSITVTYTSATSKRIKTVTDGADRVYSFTYNSSDLLTQISFEGKGDMEQPIQISFGYSNSQLETVTDPAGDSCTYEYENKLLSYVVDIDGYEVSIFYNTLAETYQPYRVQSVYECHNNEWGGNLRFAYAHNQTTVIDHNGNARIMQFNNMGNTVCVQDDEGKASFVEYAKNDPENTTERANQMTAASKLQDTVDNEFRDGSFEFGDFWGRTTSEDLETAYTTEVVYHGDKALKITHTAAGDWRGVQSPDITAQPGETVTISAYVKTEAGKVSLDIMDSNMIQYVNGSGLAANQDWTRLQASYTNNSDSARTVFARLVAAGPGVAYLDCAQGEKSVTASRFNLVSNGDFHSGGPFAWTKGSSAESQPTLSASAISKLDGKVAQLPGSATAQRSLYQTVKVKGATGDSFVLAGWAKADSAPMKADWDTRGRRFAITAKFNYTDGSSSDAFTADFNPDSDVWQYSAASLVAKKAYSSITVSLVYNYNVNTAYFDGIQLFKESFGSSYTYDDEGNVLSVTDLQKQRTEYEYNANNDLVEVIQDGSSKLTYTYDGHHNVKTAQTEEGLKYTFTYDAYGNNLTVSAGSGESKITASATYSTDGNRCESVTDAAGNVTRYSYDEDTNTLNWVALPKDVAKAEEANETEIATRTRYEYDELLRVTKVWAATDTNKVMSVNYTYEDGKLTWLITPYTEYSFLYGNFGLRDSVKAGERLLAEYSYTDDGNHYLESLDYGNGDSVEYTYDNKGRLTTEVYEDGATVTYDYDSEGELAQVKDSDSGITRKFFYDLTRRMGEYTEVGTGLKNRVRYTYDAKGNFSELRQEINGTTRVTSYDYDDDNRVTGHTSGTDGKSFAYDDWGRLSGTASTNGGGAVIENSYTYCVSDGKPTGQVEQLAIDAAGYDVTYTYTYDANGNILTVSDGTYTTRYTYDSANQLIREDNQAGGFTHMWSYDANGNILCRDICSYTTEELVYIEDDITFDYGADGWGDVLVYSSWYGGTESDEIGNLTYNRGHSYTWRHGRELATLNNWSFTYDADGLRTKRTNGTYTYDYSYIDGQLWYMKANNQELFISWDAAGNPWTLRTGGQTYYYVTNLQGDVTAILSGSGDPMVTYTYDAWGNILEIGGEDANTLGRTNPLRYRGYVYDQETGLYYLQSRYYDPEMGRFISADAYYSTGQGFVGNNMFAYCLDNPINMHDPDGTCSRFLFWETDCGKATCKSSKNYNPLATRVAVIYDARTSGSFFGLFGGEGFKFQAEETIEDLESSHRVEALPFTTVGGFVDSWNSLAGEYEEAYIFSHGYPGGLSCAGESISRSGDEYSFGSLHSAEVATVYLYSCNGATHSPNGSVAYQLAQLTGGSVWAITDGKLGFIPASYIPVPTQGGRWTVTRGNTTTCVD